MRLRALFSRLALTTAASGLAVTGLALPAQADPKVDVPYVGIFGPEAVTVINGQSKTVKFELYNLSSVAAKDVVLDFGSKTAPISPELGFIAPSGCTDDVCRIGDLKAGERRTLTFTVKPAAATSAAPAETIALSVTAGGKLSDETVIGVVRTDKGGVDLEMADIADLRLSGGASADVPVVVRNSGDQDVKALGLVVLANAITPLLDYTNCERIDEEGVGAVVCVFNDTLPAGGTFTLPAATPLRVKAPAGVAGPFDYQVYVGAVGLTDKFVYDFAKRTTGATGKVLELEAVASVSAAEPDAVEDLNEDDNYTDFAVRVPKTSADSSAVGDAFTGAVGEDDTVQVGLRNLGPSAVIPASPAWIQAAHIRLPTGIQLTRVDERCAPGTSIDDVDETVTDLSEVTDLVCVIMESVPAGDRYLFELSGEILDVAEHKAGAVTVDGGVQDAKSGNDKAALTVAVTSTGGEGGSLPITGAPAGLIAAGGAVLLAAGVIALRTARRRRIVTVVE
ncbi:hypothetical protein [Actinoplanes utahensis]|uniref:Peptidase n=1 Tax=Actinoplanes utahensis TaxID=1869 RepID=A0A0A6XEM2_ACTUT|nr:hypothetical protein [Actinoplanes utahensis]KHD78562.1 hypothetical protein MB27_05000 [Actinoplanes utahensis]GIF31757.1 hypothetical protein Aut01nite_47430 [Actinoplanes utahensis]